jgi:ubiquinone/menaquinone biosynthesis C-methylase UbiE
LTAALTSLLRRALRTVHHALVQVNRQERLAQCMLDLILPDNSPLAILDVGCGSGQIALNLQNRLPHSQLQGVDVLVRPDTYIPVESFDGLHLPFPDQSFDYVLLIDVLHHTMEPQQVLAECVRVSRKAVLIKDHLCNSRWDYWRLRVADWIGNWGHGVALPYNYLSSATWNQLYQDLKIQPVQYRQKLQLYAALFEWLFEKTIHFSARLERIPQGEPS